MIEQQVIHPLLFYSITYNWVKTLLSYILHMACYNSLKPFEQFISLGYKNVFKTIIEFLQF
jgi:hypothetical protein